MRSLIVLFVLVFGLGTMTTVAAETETILDQEEQECFDAINALRAKFKLQLIQLDPTIVEDCRKWSAKLQSERRLYHGSRGENCARGNTSGRATFNQWLTSPGHYAFMLSRGSDTGGIGRSGNYWTFRAVDLQPNEPVKTSVPKRYPSKKPFRLFRR